MRLEIARPLPSAPEDVLQGEGVVLQAFLLDEPESKRDEGLANDPVQCSASRGDGCDELVWNGRTRSKDMSNKEHG